MQSGGGRRAFELVPQDQWASKSAAERCAKCGKSFGIFRPPDNCHACGRVFCSGGACLDNAMVLPGHPGTAPVPVCDGCATAIRRIQQDSEMAVHRCQILEELLNEQTLQSETLVKQSKELRSENENLVKERVALQGEVKKLELQLEVAVARNNLHSGGLSDTGGGSSAATSPVAASSGQLGVGSPLAADGDSAAEAEKRLEKKKKQLDMREATLQEALKKVSNDAARIVSQRNALQELEKTLQATVSQQLTESFEAQRVSLEEGLLAEQAKLRQEFQSFMRKAAQREKSRASKQPPAEGGGTPTIATSSGVPQTEVDALRASHEAQLAQLQRSHETQAAQLEESIQDWRQKAETAQEMLQRREQELISLQDSLRRAQTWEEDKLILQGSVNALKRQLEEVQEKAATAETLVQQLQSEKGQWEEAEAERQAEAEAEARQHQEQQQQQDRTAEAEALVAVQELQTKLDAAVKELEEVKADHKTACEQYEALVARLQLDVKEAQKEKGRAVTEERQKRASQHAHDMQALKEEHAKAETAAQKKHEAHVEKLEKKHAAQVAELRAALTKEKERGSAAAKGKGGTAKSVESLQAEHAKEVEALTAAIAELKRKQLADEARRQGELRKALEEQASSLQRQQEMELGNLKAAQDEKVATLEASHQQQIADLTGERDALKEQARALRVEVERHGEAEKANAAKDGDGERPASSLVEVSLTPSEEEEERPCRAAGATQQVDMDAVAAAILAAARTAYEVVLSEAAAGLSTTLTYLQAAAVTSAAEWARWKAADRKRLEEQEALASSHAEAMAKLQRQLKAAKRESQGHEQRATELAQEALQHKRTAVAQSEEMTQLKEKLRKTQKAATRAERQSAAAVTAAAASTPGNLRPMPASAAAAAAAGHPSPSSFPTFAASSLAWERSAQVLLVEYADCLVGSIVPDVTGAAGSTVAALTEALGKYREMGRRNAAALEQTTNTIRTVQNDLRARAEELADREQSLEQRETRLSTLSAALARKRQAIAHVCEGLHTVVGKLKEREEARGLHDETLAAMAEGSAALLADECVAIDGNSS